MTVLNLSIKWRENKRAIFFCLVAAIGALCYGYNTIYYTGIQGMKAFVRDYGRPQADDTYALATSFLSVSASVVFAGELVGALITTSINDRFGRKAVFLCAAICIVVGAVIQVCSFGNTVVFCVGSAFIGLGTGQFTTTCLTYISEVAPTGIRGPALMCFQFMQSCSQLIGACVNQGMQTVDSPASYRVPMSLVVVLPLMMLISLPFIPESPTWYLTKGNREQAAQSLRRISHSPNYNPERDLEVIEKQVQNDREITRGSTSTSLFTDPIERRKLLYSCGATFCNQINGIQFWYTYGVVFAQSLDVAQPYTITTIICVVQIFTVGASVVFGNKIRRRTNLMVCTAGMFISLMAVGVLGVTHRGKLSHTAGIAIVAFTFINIVCYNFSVGPLSFTIASEMAVGRNKNKITACAIGTFFFTAWLMVFTSPYLYYAANLGPMLGFIYAGGTLLTFAHVWFCVGETTGRTNAEIERLFAEKVPVRRWATHVFVDIEDDDSSEVSQVIEHIVVKGGKGWAV